MKILMKKTLLITQNFGKQLSRCYRIKERAMKKQFSLKLKKNSITIVIFPKLSTNFSPM